MAGLYIHIPFCAKRCLYCDFFSNTDMKYKESYIDALIREMAQRKDYLFNEPLDTIYFGGGTPSQLSADDYARIFEAIHSHFDLSACKEITLEANPDDISPGYIHSLRALPFNRVSMGVQSFIPEDLLFLRRRHNREQAIRAVEICKDAGLTNISIDLIYGLPGQTNAKWESNLEEALLLDIPHISAYHLIYEEDTALYDLLDKGQITPLDEDDSLTLFSTLIDTMEQKGYQHYEISNFARSGYRSLHNSAYWEGTKYLGLGPSAHSYNGETREWNIASLPAYIKETQGGDPVVEREILTLPIRYNDYIITRLRTAKGIDLREIQSVFGSEYYNYCKQQTSAFIRDGLLVKEQDTIRLSRQGIFLSDGIMRELIRI